MGQEEGGQVGDVLVVTHSGRKGWKYGRIVQHADSTPLYKSDPTLDGWGPDGWFPSTFAAPIQVTVADAVTAAVPVHDIVTATDVLTVVTDIGTGACDVARARGACGSA